MTESQNVVPVHFSSKIKKDYSKIIQKLQKAFNEKPLLRLLHSNEIYWRNSITRELQALIRTPDFFVDWTPILFVAALMARITKILWI